MACSCIQTVISISFPLKGGHPRRLDCNLPRMNSWHTFSPNGRWLAFSSKGRSLYTQLFLTHIDENGKDSPAILVENATAANRGVNIPEFVNIPPNGLTKMDAPATEFAAYPMLLKPREGHLRLPLVRMKWVSPKNSATESPTTSRSRIHPRRNNNCNSPGTVLSCYS